MFRRIMISVVAAGLLAMPALAADPTADEVVANNLKAHGGVDKMKAINTQKMSGSIELQPGLNAPIAIYQKRPDKLRFELTIQGKTIVQAYDGKTGWYINPLQGKTDASLMGEDQLKVTQEQADVDGPLVDYKAKGNSVELQGKDTVEGSDVYKLKVTLKDGTVRVFYIDPDSWLEIKEEDTRTIRGSERQDETTYGDYKEVGGLIYSFSQAQGDKGSQEKQKITIEKIEQNIPMDDAMFKMPASAAPAAAPKADDKKPETKKDEVKK
jgi:outer membrane lipoprotein-sorting protein